MAGCPETERELLQGTNEHEITSAQVIAPPQYLLRCWEDADLDDESPCRRIVPRDSTSSAQGFGHEVGQAGSTLATVTDRQVLGGEEAKRVLGGELGRGKLKQGCPETERE